MTASEELRAILIDNFKSGTKKGGYSWDLLQVNKAQVEIEALLKSEQTKLLDKLLEKKIYGHLAVPNCTYFVPVSIIEELKTELKD